MTDTPIYLNGRVVGSVCNDVFRKRIRGSRHLLHSPPAISCDVAVMQQAEAAGAVVFEVLDVESKTIYQASIAHFWKAGVPINRGFGKQWALPLEGFTKHTRGGGIVAATIKTEPQPEQLKLGLA